MSPPKLDIGAELLVVLTHEIEAGMYDDTIAELRAARTLKERREILRIAFTAVTIEAEEAFSAMQVRASRARKG